MIKIKEREFIPYLKEAEILEKVAFLGKQIVTDYEGTCPVLIGVLNGSFMFLADLIKHIDLPIEISFIKIASYEATASSGKVREILGLELDIENRDVIIVEDIIDTGLSMAYLLNKVKGLRPKSVAVASLLLKPASLKENIRINYLGFEIPDKFVIGYGLDFDGQGRNLKQIYQLK